MTTLKDYIKARHIDDQSLKLLTENGWKKKWVRINNGGEFYKLNGADIILVTVNFVYGLIRE
ncbi:MAG: hypothetical protein GX660_25545 [Clostridiaceae bacterium]|nr:hypothetical protein [Clostridiaceae bacterium]